MNFSMLLMKFQVAIRLEENWKIGRGGKSSRKIVLVAIRLEENWKRLPGETGRSVLRSCNKTRRELKEKGENQRFQVLRMVAIRLEENWKSVWIAPCPFKFPNCCNKTRRELKGTGFGEGPSRRAEVAIRLEENWKREGEAPTPPWAGELQ